MKKKINFFTTRDLIIWSCFVLFPSKDKQETTSRFCLLSEKQLMESQLILLLNGTIFSVSFTYFDFFSSFSQIWNFILAVSCVLSWNLLWSYSLSGIWIMWYINNKHVPHLRNATKIKHAKGTENAILLRSNINWDSIKCLFETKWNPEVVSRFKNCLLLFGNITK